MTITITVAGRIATATATTQVVAGNTYPVALSLDSEWTGSLFMRVRFGSLYYDIPFASSDTTVDVQFPVGYPEVGIGVFSEALQVCTNEVRVRLLRSILEAGEEVVEFDGDLYDQWEGEVTTLLTDDAFDATSTKPVQNAVITAWKGTVALDADVVHKAGAETIAGVKTFTSIPIAYGNTGIIRLKSNKSDTYEGVLSEMQCSSETTVVGKIFLDQHTQYRVMAQQVNAPTSGFARTTLRAYDDKTYFQVPEYLPVDGGGSHLAPSPSSVAMSSGMIAVDPRLVHTTGNETVAGNKTLTGNMTFTGNVSLSRPAAVDRFERSGTQGYWQPLAKARRGSGASTGLLGLFWLLPTNYDLAKYASLVLVYQRTLDSTRDSLGITVLCGNGVDVSTLAVAKVENDIVVYAQKRASLHVSVMIPIVQTRNFAYQTDIWSDATSMDELAELPSGAVYATLANAFQPKV